MRTTRSTLLWLMTTLALAAPVAAADAPAQPAEQARFSLEELGFTEALKKSATRSTVTLALPTRGDRVLTEASLQLTLTGDASASGLAGLEVLVNDERVSLLDGRALGARREHMVAIPPALIESRSSLTLRLISAGSAAICAGAVPPGSWQAIAGGSLVMSSTALRLPNDLGVLPLPFFDPQFDRSVRVNLAFLRAPGPAQTRVAALLASFIGLRGDVKASFAVTVGALPQGHALVLAEGAQDAATLGLPAPAGPELRLLDNPRDPTAMAKLLVISGRTVAELETAALALSDGHSGGKPLAGELVIVAARPPRALARDYDAPRWVALREVIPLSQLPGGKQLVHEGTGGTTFRLPFRLPPDLFFWLTHNPALELAFSAQLARGIAPPRVSVELNGHYVATLPAPTEHPTGAWGRVRLPVNRDHLAGFNELAIHLDYGPQGCAGTPTIGTTRFAIDADSSGLRLRGHTHFASLPDLSLFVHDGFPFTRRADLSETTAVLPARPSPEEIGSLLSLVAGFSGVTGRPASGLTVTTAEDLLGAPPASHDLLVVGAVANQPLLQLYGDRLPLRLGGSGAEVALPSRSPLETLRFALSGRLLDGERSRAREIVGLVPRFAAVMAIESPLASGRAAVFVTAHQAAGMPSLGDLQGPAESRYRGSDVLVAIGAGGSNADNQAGNQAGNQGSHDARFMFRLGLSYETGQLRPWHRFLWQMSQHWVSLFPAALLGIVLLALVSRAALRARVERRLLEIGESPTP
jgi:hypothetical protein